jgi:hypothetical protein
MARYETRQYKSDAAPTRGVFIIDTESNSPTKPVIEFHIGNGHTLDAQIMRVVEYAAFLNMQDEAAKKAMREITIASAVAQRMTGNK